MAPKYFFHGYTNARSVVKPASTPMETILERRLVKVTTAKSRKEAKARTVATKTADDAEATADRRRRRAELRNQVNAATTAVRRAATPLVTSRVPADGAELSTEGLNN